MDILRPCDKNHGYLNTALLHRKFAQIIPRLPSINFIFWPKSNIFAVTAKHVLFHTTGLIYFAI